jgi:hypothetical protein
LRDLDAAELIHAGPTAQTIERLGARARRAHIPPRTLAQRYVEEGLRMDEIDEWSELNEQEAAEAHGAWQTGQAALQQ